MGDHHCTCVHSAHCGAWAEEKSRSHALDCMDDLEGRRVVDAGGTEVPGSSWADSVHQADQMTGEVDWGDYSILHLVAGTG